MRFPLEVAEAVRGAWPEHKPLFARISVTDWIDGGWTVEDSIIYAKELKARGIDLIHCSSSGFDGAKPQVGALYQVPLSAAVRRGAEIPTAAVGLITTAQQAESILAAGDADLIALARQALEDPNWAASCPARAGWRRCRLCRMAAAGGLRHPQQGPRAGRPDVRPHSGIGTDRAPRCQARRQRYSMISEAAAPR